MLLLFKNYDITPIMVVDGENLKAKAKEYHWETDGECMLAYIKADTNGEYHLKDRRPVYTSWDETENGNITVYVEL